MPVVNYVYPTDAEIMEIEREKSALLTADDPMLSEIMPITERDTPLLIWEQEDNYRGLQQVRGIGGDPPRVQRTGARQFTMLPGYYGEWSALDETELTMRRPPGQFGGRIDVTDLVMREQDRLLARRYDRLRYIGWQLHLNGTFAVAANNGAILHTDAFPIQTFVAPISWVDPLNAVPFANFRDIQLMGTGKGVNFGAGARAYMNRVTANRFLSNRNQGDLAGRRTQGLGSINSIPQLNELLAGDDLPTIVVYHDGYFNEAGVFQLWIPDGKVLVVGQRPAGQRVSEYIYTRNINNLGTGVGAYQRVLDHGDREIPRRIEVHDGHNGGPAIYYPSAEVVMTV